MTAGNIDAGRIWRRASWRLVGVATLLALGGWGLVASVLPLSVVSALTIPNSLGDPFFMLVLIVLPNPEPGSGSGIALALARVLAAGSLVEALAAYAVALALRTEARWAMSCARVLGWVFLTQSVLRLLGLVPWAVPVLTLALTGGAGGSIDPTVALGALGLVLTSCVLMSIVFCTMGMLRTLAAIRTDMDIRRLSPPVAQPDQ